MYTVIHALKMLALIWVTGFCRAAGVHCTMQPPGMSHRQLTECLDSAYTSLAACHSGCTATAQQGRHNSPNKPIPQKEPTISLALSVPERSSLHTGSNTRPRYFLRAIPAVHGRSRC